MSNGRNEPLQPKQYKRFKPNPIETDSTLDLVLSAGIDSLKMGRPPAYADNEQGLTEFRAACIDYFDFIKRNNQSEATEKRLVPDVEGLCSYIGITRPTLLSYQKSRGGEWTDTINQIKGLITACKKELAYHQQIPTVLAIFDLCNNSDYVNASEFKLQTDVYKPEPKTLTREEIALNYGIELPPEQEEMPLLPEQGAALPDLTQGQAELLPFPADLKGGA